MLEGHEFKRTDLVPAGVPASRAGAKPGPVKPTRNSARPSGKSRGPLDSAKRGGESKAPRIATAMPPDPTASQRAVVELDRTLAATARDESHLRLRLGALLEAVAGRGAHHELGFSSFEAYALQSCQRSSRWAHEARQVARARETFPGLARAMAAGDVSWSMAVLMASRATREDESPWLIAARELTVRQLRALTTERRPEPGAVCDGVPMTGARDEAGHDGAASVPAVETASSDANSAEAKHSDTGFAEATPGDGGSVEATWIHESSATVPACTRQLEVTVPIEDAWLFEATKMIVRRISGATQADAVFEALLAEGESSLLDDRRADDDALTDEAMEAAQAAWERQREAWRVEAEKRCERRLSPEARHVEARHVTEPPPDDIPDATLLATMPILELHDRVRRAARALAELDLHVGRLAEQLFAADGWRRLGYATARQYTRERLGLSLSSVKQRRALARRSGALPQIAEAIGSGAIGAEAARLVSTVATEESCVAWLARAERRTVKHLREEVAAAKLVALLTGREQPTPPTRDELAAVHAAETAIISGEVFRNTEHDRTGSAEIPPEPATTGQMSAHGDRLRQGGVLLAALRGGPPAHPQGRSRPTATLRFRVTEETYRTYRRLRRAHRRKRPHGESFLRFLCMSLIDAWRHALPPTMAYGHVYARDRFQCMSPVCSRRDVTPHHLQYRAHGGDDSESNVASLCTWCHLEGIHGGRLHAEPPAEAIRWRIGRAGRIRVDGRELRAS